MTAANLRLLLVEDERVLAAGLATALELAGYEVSRSPTLADARQRIEQNRAPYALAIIDLALPDGNGFELVQFLAHYPDTPCLVLGDHDSQPLSCQHKNILAYLVKPVEAQDLVTAVAGTYQRLPLATASATATTLAGQAGGNKQHLIAVAVGILMERHHITRQQAAEWLQQQAQQSHLTLLQQATEIVAACERLNLHPHA
ncbi:ANTAR domain-containing response regulator [Aquaspirillum serpens]|uniref:ANTAR domain-containing response regulator n=1 Tax=Aquaspirillum serpens TaxID=190 RepID=UPI0003B62F1E|nr:ANTAR domain-containing protein [Aquaspirillum serpens]